MSVESTSQPFPPIVFSGKWLLGYNERGCIVYDSKRETAVRVSCKDGARRRVLCRRKQKSTAQRQIDELREKVGKVKVGSEQVLAQRDAESALEEQLAERLADVLAEEYIDGTESELEGGEPHGRVSLRKSSGDRLNQVCVFPT